jgi:hypothetical protein
MKRLIYMAILAAAVVALAAPPVQAAESDDKFKIHGEIRLRGDYQANWVDLNDDGPTDDQGLAWPSRARLAFEGQFTENVSAWFEVQHGWVWGGNGSGFTGHTPPGFARTGQDDFELYQANFTLDKIWSDRFSLTLGRQELSLGNELLLGDNDFYMGFSHDGVTGVWDFDKVDITVWYFRTNEGTQANSDSSTPPPFAIPGSVTGGQDFYGGYATWTFKGDAMFDVYLMYQDFRTDLVSGEATATNLATVGVRFARDRMGENGFLWNIEYAQQAGEIEGGDANVIPDYPNDATGSILEGMLGYNFHRGENNHRVYGTYTMMSGDEADPASAAGQDYEGFIGVAGDFHGRLGMGDWFLPDTFYSLGGAVLSSNRGIDAYSVGYNGFFKDRHEIGVAYWDYTLNETTGIAPMTSDDIGSAYDIWYGFDYTKNVAFEVSYSMLDPGDFLVSGGSGPVAPGDFDDSLTRIYGQARLRF